MDFLDPRKRKAHRTRLMIGYVLFGIAIALTSIILVYGASGYSYNPRSGKVVQNGLLFVDSHPSAATIYLNGKDIHSNTAARLILPTGEYQLIIKKAGYRDWQTKFTLNENSVSRYTYPLLIPAVPLVKTIKQYPALPAVMTETPDAKWLLVLAPSSDLSVLNFEEFDTSKMNQPTVTLSYPQGLLTNLDKPSSSLSVVQWSTDNEHFLLKHSFTGGNEYILMSRSDPTKSFNINTTFNIAPTDISLVNKKADQLYVFNQTDQSLFMADVNKRSLQPLLSHVLAYKDVASDLFMYVTDQNVASGQVMARIWNKGTTYPLYTFAVGNKYLIDGALFQGHWYYVAGSDMASRVNLFKDPLNDLKNSEVNRAIPLLSLAGAGNGNISFSPNFKFVAITAGQKVTVYDIETDSHYQYDLPISLSSPIHWFDGYHFVAQNNGSIFLMDYDSTNTQIVSPTIWDQAAVQDKSLNFLITIAQVDASPSVALQMIDLRAGVDLPKQ